MAEYNPSKIIKDGNTYNFRDNTKIPLAGSNQIGGSLIPATTDAYDLGGPSYQWNNAYIKSLTINGVACGDILTYNASEFVKVTGNQTIGGLKAFSTNGCKFYKQIVINHDLSYSKNTPPSQSAYHNLMFTDASGWWGAYIENVTDTSGNSTLAFYVRNTDEIQSRVYLKCGIDGSFSMYPLSNNVWDLGTPASQWKNTYTRNILIDNDINIASSLINKTSNSGVLTMRGGISDTEGASLSLYGKDYGGSPGLIGNIYMTAYGSSDYTNFRIYPNGIMRVYNNSTATTKNVAMQEDVVPRSGGAVMTGNSLGPNIDYTTFQINGASADEKGAFIRLYGKDYADTPFAGSVYINTNTGSIAQKNMFLFPNGTWTWDGTACQLTSDQRLKQQITEIDDKLLDAWEDVNLVQFKYNDAVDVKGSKARLHTGYVVQQIDSACQSHGVDISAYGLYCHEEYPQETEEVEVEQADGTKVKEKKIIREASEHYSLRYTEVYAVECMYLRRCIARLTARIEELEKGNNTK